MQHVCGCDGWAEPCALTLQKKSLLPFGHECRVMQHLRKAFRRHHSKSPTLLQSSSSGASLQVAAYWALFQSSRALLQPSGPGVPLQPSGHSSQLSLPWLPLQSPAGTRPAPGNPSSPEHYFNRPLPQEMYPGHSREAATVGSRGRLLGQRHAECEPGEMVSTCSLPGPS